MPPLQYAILWHHDVPQPHYDMLFETLPNSDLATWRSPVWPIEHPTEVTRLRDHRRAYLKYEGLLTERRGSVERVAGGDCELHLAENAAFTIRLLTGSTPQILTIRQIDEEQWLVEPGSF